MLVYHGCNQGNASLHRLNAYVMLWILALLVTKKKKSDFSMSVVFYPKVSGKKAHMIKIMSPAHVGWYTGSFLRCCLFHITRIGISTKTGSALFCRRHLHNGRRLHITSVLVQRWIYYQEGKDADHDSMPVVSLWR